MYLTDCLQKLLQTFGRKILSLYGYQSSICRRQCIDGEHTKGGSTVQQDIIVLPFCSVQHLFEHLFPVHAVYQSHLQSCQFDVGRDEVYALCMVQDALTGLDRLVVHGFLHQSRQCGRQLVRLLPAHADGKTALRVSVHQQNFFALHRQPDAQIFTGGGLAGAAFLVDDGYRGCFL